MNLQERFARAQFEAEGVTGGASQRWNWDDLTPGNQKVRLRWAALVISKVEDLLFQPEDDDEAPTVQEQLQELQSAVLRLQANSRMSQPVVTNNEKLAVTAEEFDLFKDEVHTRLLHPTDRLGEMQGDYK